MIETLTVITLCLLYLVFFRPGKTPKLENPLVIERTGIYRITLAPQLNLAQPFIEAIARRLNVAHDAPISEVVRSFEVHDKHVTPRGFDYYVLTIMQCNGMLYFEAMPPSHGNQGAVGNAHVPDRALVEILQTVAGEQGVDLRLIK